MTRLTTLKRLFRRDDRELDAFLRREEKHLRRTGPGTRGDAGRAADELRYEILRAGI